MTVRSWSQDRYWKKVGSARWQPMRYVTGPGNAVDSRLTNLRLFALETTEVLARFVKHVPQN